MLVHKKPVAVFDADGRLIGQWDSMLQAAVETGYSKTVIKNCAQCEQRDGCEMCSYFRKYRVTWKYTADEV